MSAAMIPVLISLLLTQTAANRGESIKQDVRVVVVRQERFRNPGHHPENDRRVVFGLANQTSHPVVVYGFSFNDEFEPTGYLMDLDKSTGKWLYPTPENRPLTWRDVSELEKETYILPPGRTITFSAELSRAEVGKHFRRIVYVSSKEGEVPREVRGEEFVLR